MSDPIYEAQAYEIAKMARSISALEAENAKLREQVTQLRDDWESECDYAGQMEAKEKRAVSENAKLRELIADVHEALRADKAGMFHKLILANMEDDMRELGIEGES